MATLQQTSFRTFIKHHAVLTYYVLTFAISWGGIFLVMLIGHSGILATSDQFTRLLPFTIPALLGGPSIAGLLVTGLVSGRAGYRELWSRLRRWRVGAGWYAVALLLAPLVALLVPLALARVSPVFSPALFTTSDKTSILLFGIVWGLLVGFCEELGWTGFATPRLRRRYSMLSTGLIVGVLWGAWHLLTNGVWGAARIAGGVPIAPFLLANCVLLVAGLVAYRVLMIWVYDHTKGSLLVAMLMHAGYTAAAMTLGAATTGGDFLVGYLVSVVVWWLIAAAVILASPGSRARPETTSALSSPRVNAGKQTEIERVAVPS
jgi:membrane protease YdiL (CAAX protease family)